MNHSEIVSVLWGVADLIRDTFKRGKYQDVFLPLTVLRRLDCVLDDTKKRDPKDGRVGLVGYEINISTATRRHGRSRRPRPTSAGSRLTSYERWRRSQGPTPCDTQCRHLAPNCRHVALGPFR